MVVSKKTVAKVAAGLGLALSLALSPVSQTKAQQGITWTTGFQVQNLGTTAANVTIDLYNRDGTSGGAQIADSILTSKTYFPIPNAAAGFQGSAVVSADQPVAAILNILGTATDKSYYSEAVTGVSQGSTTVSLPLILRGNSGFNTWFAVQNAGTTAASVTVTFKAGLAGSNYTAPAVIIEPGASYVFDQRDDANASNLGAKFIGSATVTSAQPLAVVVNQIGTGASKTQLSYSGFASGSPSVVLPLVQQSNGGFFSGISIQNVSATTTATVTLTYGANTVGTGAAPANQTATLVPGASTSYIVGDPTRYVGSAVVTTGAADQQVVVVVNQLSNTGKGTAYEGIASSTATSKVSLPLLMEKNAGFFTAVQCRNVSEQAATLTLTYTPNTITGSTLTPAPVVSQNVPAGGSVTWFQNTAGQRYVGGGTVTGATASQAASPVVCIVNQVNDGQIAGDAFLTYDGINY